MYKIQVHFNPCIFIKEKFSLMRLRHKKPINSYVGQANLESSEVLDEDFEKNISTGKRPKLPKQKANYDQMKKYAQILVQFIQTINTDYNSHIKKFPAKNRPDINPKPKEVLLELIVSKKVHEEEAMRRKTQVVLKQQQKRKLQQKNKLLLSAQEERPKFARQDQPIRKRSKTIVQTPKPQIKCPPPSKKKEIDLTLEENQVPENKNQQVNGPAQMGQMMFQGANPFSVNPSNLYQSLTYTLPMYQQMLSEQLNKNPNLMMYMQPVQFQNFFSMMNMQNMQQIPQNCIPFSKLPFNQNKKQSTSKPAQTSRIPKVEVKPKNQLKTEAPNSISNGFFSKKSYSHVAIAYHIHCEKLKKSGKLGNTVNWSGAQQRNLEELDPTYPAKKIRERNHQDILLNPPHNK